MAQTGTTAEAHQQLRGDNSQCLRKLTVTYLLVDMNPTYTNSCAGSGGGTEEAKKATT